jgi:hypothetical protein
MRKPIVQASKVSSTSLVVHSLPHIDYADAFRCQLSERQTQTVDAVTRALFSQLPDWLVVLLHLRDTIVLPLGLKSSFNPTATHPTHCREELKPGMKVGLFEVLNRTPEEIVLGEDDRHLNYRVLVRLEREEGKYWAVVSTVLQFNNWLGRAYFVPVKPLHKLIVPALMRYGLEGVCGIGNA